MRPSIISSINLSIIALCIWLLLVNFTKTNLTISMFSYSLIRDAILGTLVFLISTRVTPTYNQQGTHRRSWSTYPKRQNHSPGEHSKNTRSPLAKGMTDGELSWRHQQLKKNISKG
uniref:Putative Rep n=1 Tax=Tripterygium mastrevirus A TaxID=2809269 RepID=A0A890CB08_9GEMI|nr:putative Rep [Tripterygium mastrevirus A]